MSYWVWFHFSTFRCPVFLAPYVVEVSFFFFKLMCIFDAFAKDEVAVAVLVYFRVSVFIIIGFLIPLIEHLTKTIQEKRAQSLVWWLEQAFDLTSWEAETGRSM